MRDLVDQALVEVLLATYNGERFLREQIDSILAQDYKNIRVLARDDGSSDETVRILNEYEERYSGRFRVLPLSPGAGSAKGNFLLLMKASTAKYICFSDQDDVWLPDKVTRTKQAMDELESQWGGDVPLLVFTDLQVVDDQLRTLHESFWAHEKIHPDRVHRLPWLLVQNLVTGCTMMLNRQLLELSLRMPDDALMHDHWIALLASSMGKSGIVNARTVLYRQHDRNVAGVTKKVVRTRAQYLVQRLRRSETREVQWQTSQRQAEALLKTHGAELPTKSHRLIESYQPCGAKRSRIIRTGNLIRYGYRIGFMPNLGMIFDLWTMKQR
jgi:glycosyltransferase involved in cell wall biosynthesis